MLSYFHFFGLQLMLLLNIFGSHLLPSFALYFNDGGGRFRDDDHRGRDQRPQLLLAQVIFRHGERSPLMACPNDNNQESAWPQGFGELTPLGYVQQFRLGQRLRRRYVDHLRLVSPFYRHTEVYVHSTDVNRVLQSAVANMAGFYAASHSKVIRALGFMPVPVHTVEKSKEILAASNCHARIALLNNVLTQTPEFRRNVKTTRAKTTFTALKNLCGQPVTFFEGQDRISAYVFTDTLNIAIEQRKLVPNQETTTLHKEANRLMKLENNWKNGIGIEPFRGIDFKREYRRLHGGPLLWAIIDAMLDKRRCLVPGLGKCPEEMRQRKYVTYSSNDATMASLLAALGLKTNVDRSGYVPFASTILIELWQQPWDGQFVVQVLFWPGPEDPGHRFHQMPQTRFVPGCSGLDQCPLDTFARRSQDYRPVSTALCENPNDLQAQLRANPASTQQPTQQEHWGENY